MTIYWWSGQREVHRRHRMQRRRIEQRHAGVFRLHQQRQLGATENDTFGAARDELRYRIPVVPARALEEFPPNELVIDNAAYLARIVALGRDHLDTVALRKTSAENIGSLHRVRRADQPDALHAEALDFGTQRIG